VGYFEDGSSCTACRTGETTGSTGSTSTSDCVYNVDSNAESFSLVDGVCATSTANVATGIGITRVGATLTLTPGTYTGEMATDSEWGAGGVDIQKTITIECSEADQSCILDGEDAHRAVRVYAVSSGITNFIGLKITRGSSNDAAGIIINSSDATITSCIISDNNAAPGAVSTLGECI